MGSMDDKLDGLDALLDMFPFFRCTNCNDRAADKLYLVFEYTGQVHVKPDNPTKTFLGNATDIQVGDWSDVSLHCENCGYNFPVPPEWKWKVT